MPQNFPRISRKEISEIMASAPKCVAQHPARTNLNAFTDNLRTELRKDIQDYMQPWMILLDEAVRFLIYFERHQFSRKKSPVAMLFALQLSRLRSDALSIRELVSIGQEAAASSIARSLIDGIQLAMASANDPEFCRSYMEADDDSKFWQDHIGYGRIIPRVKNFLAQTGCSQDQIDEYISRHKSLKSSLSGHVHIASYSAFRAGLTPSIKNPGLFKLGAIGEVCIHMPQLCLTVASEVQQFSACCVNGFISSNPPEALKEFKTTKLLNDAMVSAHVLQGLMQRHGDHLGELAWKIISEAKDA